MPPATLVNRKDEEPFVTNKNLISENGKSNGSFQQITLSKIFFMSMKYQNTQDVKGIEQVLFNRKRLNKRKLIFAKDIYSIFIFIGKYI